MSEIPTEQLDEPSTCNICLEVIINDKISPCNCKGSVGFHKACLKEQLNFTKDVICKICDSIFSVNLPSINDVAEKSDLYLSKGFVYVIYAMSSFIFIFIFSSFALMVMENMIEDYMQWSRYDDLIGLSFHPISSVLWLLLWIVLLVICYWIRGSLIFIKNRHIRDLYNIKGTVFDSDSDVTFSFDDD